MIMYFYNFIIMINNMTKEQLNKIDEEFASIIHDVWSKWQEYLHSKCEIQENKVSFPKLLFERWERQISTSYNLLPENEKQSDRNVFEEYYKDFLHSKLQEAYELGREEAYNFLDQQYEVSKRIEDRIRKDERERIIEIMNNLEAPDCIDDNELDEHDYIIVRVMAFKEVKEHIKQIYEKENN